jgi:hypothetical protein
LELKKVWAKAAMNRFAMRRALSASVAAAPVKRK